mgnify:CR=1 FL=1
MIVSWMTTNKCNLKCEHCYQDAADCDSRELTTVEGKAMIEQIARAGFKIMIFSGGEPLMRDDIFELVAHAAAQGLRPVFGSNGTLITDEVARKLKEAGACSMGISIDSLDAAKHDAFRGVEGAHADTLAGIEACKRAGLDFQIHTTVVNWNRDEICDITDFAQSIGAVNHSIFFLIPVGRGKYRRRASRYSRTKRCSKTSCARPQTSTSTSNPPARRSSRALPTSSASQPATHAAAWPASPTALSAARASCAHART